jgi:hypothetical protein
MRVATPSVTMVSAQDHIIPFQHGPRAHRSHEGDEYPVTKAKPLIFALETILGRPSKEKIEV